MTDWKLAPVRAVALFTLAACDPSAAPSSSTPVPEAPAELVLSCEAFRYASADALAASYGPDNLVEQTLPGPEGESYTATVLYPNDPARRLEIVWQDPDARSRPATLTVAGEDSVWTGPNALSLGQPLADVETANGGAFKLWGFDWDYGGWVSEWNGGAFSQADGCMVRVRFEPGNLGEGAVGDSEFDSNSDVMRRALPVVRAFALVYPSE
jgi:hypothetical protein